MTVIIKKKKDKKNTMVLNVLFAVTSAAILLFLWNAPEETTSPLPKDDIHKNFHQIKNKKEAEKSCLSCHDTDKESPLSEEHPPKFRCLFCHKR